MTLTIHFVPSYIASQIWSKAREVGVNDICSAPGSDNCWTVQGDIGKPYIVEKNTANKFICDSHCCLHYKTSNICAHIVGVEYLLTTSTCL